jgi:hypothetical protein
LYASPNIIRVQDEVGGMHVALKGNMKTLVRKREGKRPLGIGMRGSWGNKVKICGLDASGSG